MNLDRKTFLKKGILYMGEMFLQPGRFVAEPAEETAKPARLGLAAPDNGLCLSQRGGCFTCLEQCPREAITIAPGEGIEVNRERCDGCGVCEHVCPLSPVAIRVKHL